MLMPNGKQLLYCLDRNTVVELFESLGFGSSSALSKKNIIERLTNEDAFTFPELLNKLSMASLKVICRNIGARASATSKQELINTVMIQMELECTNRSNSN
jgi:hypothetical protein